MFKTNITKQYNMCTAQYGIVDDLIFEMMESGNGLFDAVSDCDISKTELLIQSGNFDVNEQDEYGRTVLFLSACRGYFEVTKLLIDSGANVNCTDHHGNSPLHWCGHPDTIALLVSSGADIKKRNNAGLMPKTMAKRRGLRPDVIELFEQLEKPASNPDQKFEQYQSLFQEFSSEIGWKNMAFLLLGICFLSLYFAYIITGSSRHLEIGEPISIEKH